MSEFQKDEIQRKIYNLISHNPGIHLSKIAELLNMNISEIKYYLKLLENKVIIYSTKESGYEKYYIEKRRVKAREKRTLETRQLIYNIVIQNPGLHLSKVAEMLEMSVPLADYHLSNMQKEGKITIVKDSKGYFKRYYIAESGIKNKEKQILEILRKKASLKIILFIMKFPNIQHKDIMEHLNMPSSTLSYHLIKLEENDIIETHPHGREKGYTLKDKAEIIRILKKYERHIELHLAIDEFKDMWDDLSYRDSLG